MMPRQNKAANTNNADLHSKTKNTDSGNTEQQALLDALYLDKGGMP